RYRWRISCQEGSRFGMESSRSNGGKPGWDHIFLVDDRRIVRLLWATKNRPCKHKAVPMSSIFNRRAFLQRTAVLATALVPGAPWSALGGESSSGQGRFNVRRFGAKGNGEAKDTAAVQRAIDAAGREGGC